MILCDLALNDLYPLNKNKYSCYGCYTCCSFGRPFLRLDSTRAYVISMTSCKFVTLNCVFYVDKFVQNCYFYDIKRLSQISASWEGFLSIPFLEIVSDSTICSHRDAQRRRIWGVAGNITSRTFAQISAAYRLSVRHSHMVFESVSRICFKLCLPFVMVVSYILWNVQKLLLW